MRVLRKAWLGVLVVVLFALGAGVMGCITPGGFLPNEDQGAFFVQITLPPGASVNRTEVAADLLVTQLQQMPQVAHVMSVIGFSLLGLARRSQYRVFPGAA